MGQDRVGLGCGPDFVLAVMKEKETDLTVTNEPSPLPQLPVYCSSQTPFSPSVTLPYSPTIFFLSTLNVLSSFVLTYQALFLSLSFTQSCILNFTFVYSLDALPLRCTFQDYFFLLCHLRHASRFLHLKWSHCMILCSTFSGLFSPFNR